MFMNGTLLPTCSQFNLIAFKIHYPTGFALKCQQCSNEDTNFKCSSINDNGNEVECKSGEDYCVYVTYTDGELNQLNN